ncbi:MAG: hypothetical protein ACOCUS_05790, partial [Polyangiales bacterium]
MSTRSGALSRIGLLSIVAGAVSCGPPGAGPEPRYVAVHNALTSMGMAQTGPISEGSLAEGADARVVRQLEGGVCYTFVALGSDGAKDVGLRVFDEAGEELGRDTTHDRHAAAQVCPERTGDYQVVVEMLDGQGGYTLSSWSSGEGGGGGTGDDSAVAVADSGAGTCASPLRAEIGRPMQGDTSQGSSTMQGSCARGAAPEQVYRVEIGERAQLSATLQSTFDGSLYLMEDCGNARTELACNDDAVRGETTRSQLDVGVEPGTYYLVVDGYGNESGSYELIVSAAELRPLEEVCSDAEAISAGQRVTGSTEGEPDYFQASCAGGTASPDRVYSIDASRRSRLRVAQRSDHDGALHIRSRCTDATSEVACNDDFRSPRESVITTVVEPGRYYVVTDGYSRAGQSNAGNYSFTAELVPDVGSGSVQGDGCGDAVALPTGQQVELDTFPARDDARGSCGGEDGADLVYRIDVDSRSRARVEVRESQFEGVMYLRRTCDDSDSEMECVQIPPSSPKDQVGELETELSRGSYYLFVDGVRADALGEAKVQLIMEDLAALERACQQAPLLRPGRT